MSLPRNVRTKTPRAVRLRSAQRVVEPLTPTPPPVAVSMEPEVITEAPAPALDPLPRPRWLVKLGMSLVALACVASAIAWRQTMQDFDLIQAADAARAVLAPTAKSPTRAKAAPPKPAATAVPVGWPTEPAVPERPKNGWIVKYDGHVPLEGGVLHTPRTFDPEGDEFDLIVHFHGDVAIVRESVEHAKLNAALAIINVGIRSAPYRKAYQAPGAFEALLAQVRKGLQRRGMRNPKLRRLALTSWSAGYGAVESVLEHRKTPSADGDPLDAIIALDGVHAGYIDGDNDRISERTIRAFIQAARAATHDQLMVSLTHSEIDPGVYAGTRRSQLYLLEQLGVVPVEQPMLPMPPVVDLVAARGAVAVREAQKMVPTSDTRVGSLRVQGFAGNTRSHHAAHLTQMASIGLPDLARRWAKTTPKTAD